MSDYAQGLPVRSEADGTDNRVQVKVVDHTNPGTQQMSVDTDNAAKVLATGHDVGGVNRTILTSNTGQVHVVVDGKDSDETPVQDYNTASAVAAAGSSTHTYTVPGGKTLLLKAVIMSASARSKVEIKSGVVASETTKAVGFGTASDPNVYIRFEEPVQVAAASDVLVIRTNTDNQAQDVYSTIVGILV